KERTIELGQSTYAMIGEDICSTQQKKYVAGPYDQGEVLSEPRT
ncbi:7265_t:CDS:1, partial [Funneliformis caledonium]